MIEDEIRQILQRLASGLDSINSRLDSIEKRLGEGTPPDGMKPPPLTAPPVQEAKKEAVPPAPPAAEDVEPPLPPPPDVPPAREEPAKGPAIPPPPPVRTPPRPMARPPIPPPPPPRKTDEVSMEKKIGIWLSRVGVVLVFFAAAFFLKIAYDHLGEMGRASMGIIMGISFLVVGEVMESRGYSPLARALTGGGLMILYLALFATTAYFKLIGAPAAFLLMVLVTATGVTLSVRYDSQVVLILALLGGFATPALVSTGVDRQVVLMLYMILLDSALIGIAYWRKWRGISLLCFAATIILFCGWAAKFYADDKFAITFTFATAFFILFAIDSILHGLLREEEANPEDLLLVTLNAVIYFAAMYGLIKDAHMERMLGGYALGVSIFYFLQSRAAFSLIPEDVNVQKFLTGFAVGFLTLAIPLQLDYESVTVVWAVEAAALTSWGLYSKNDIFYYGGLAVLVMAVVHLFSADIAIYQKHLRKNEDAKLMLSVVVTYLSVLASAGGIILAHHYFDDRLQYPRAVYIGAYIFEVLLFMVFMMVLNHYSFKSGTYSTALYSSARRGEVLNVSLILGIYSSVLVAVGILYRLKWMRYMGLPLLGFTLLKVVIYDLKGLNMSYRVISFLALGFLFIGLSFLYGKYKDRVEGIALADHGKPKEVNK